MGLAKWWQQWRCKHEETTNRVTVSGYGYTEYRVWFCCRCAKGFILQTGEQR